jgi:two-component system chemotaxis response regulator CheV
MDYINEKYEDFEDDDEIDLLSLVSADTNSINQYLAFVGSNDEIYAINVSKVRELLVYKDLMLVKNSEKGSIIKATADIRGEMTTIVNFDEWFGNEVLPDSDYELVILAGFGGHNIGIMIKKVEYIINVNSSQMHSGATNNAKANFIVTTKINSKERLCTIFDGDKMLLDIFDDLNEPMEQKSVDLVQKKDKLVLFADDSKYIRKIVYGLFEKLQIKSQIYENGQELYDALQTISHQDIGLIITDLEMPIMDGNTLIKKIKEKPEYNKLPLIVHTNMSNDVMENSLLRLGANAVIGKIDIAKLSEAIVKHFQ